jgi:integrase
MPKLAENPHRNANGKWYFRLRIPQDLLGKIEGHGFGKTDYRISLKTRDEAEAKRRSKEAHKKFVATIELKREELKASQSGKAKAAIFNRFEYDLRQRGIHPSQAPKVTASQEDQKKYWDAYHSFIYGDWDQEAQTLDGGLDVLITELASNHDYSRSSEDLKALKDAIAERDAALAFMQGRIGSDAFNDGVPTLQKAWDLYVKKLESNSRKSPHHISKDIRRVERLVKTLAVQLGGNLEVGLCRPLDSITQDDANLFVQNLHQRVEGGGQKSSASVGRELSIIASLYNLAEKETKASWPVGKRGLNPFAERRSKLEEAHTQNIRKGVTPKLNRRAFRPEELDIFTRDYLPRMNEEAQLITLISMHTGCRIGDAAGFMMSEYWGGDAEDSIPFLEFKDNRLRNVTKDGFGRQVPLFGVILSRLGTYHAARKAFLLKTNPGLDDAPLFPRYGREDGSGFGSASQIINKHIHELRGDDRRLTFHSFRHTLQAKFLAASASPDHSSYIGGWKNQINKGLQKQYQEEGIPLKALLESLTAAHKVENWVRGSVQDKMKNVLRRD